MLTLTGNGRLTRDVELRGTRSGKSVATVSVASDRRDRNSDPVYVDLILWEGQAEAAAQHLVKGQAVTFSGRFEPRPYQTSSGEQRVAIELHNVDLEYGARPRGHDAAEPACPPAPASTPNDDDIPF
jgi:single-strand DNA-binding protein